MGHGRYKLWKNVKYKITLDHPITRRKRFHVVQVVKTGEVVFRSRLLSDCLAWLVAEDQVYYMLEPLADWEGPEYSVIYCQLGDESWLN